MLGKLKDLNNGEVRYAHGPQDSILSRHQFLPNSSLYSAQIQPKILAEFFFVEMDKLILKLYGNVKDKDSQGNFEKE